MVMKTGYRYIYCRRTSNDNPDWMTVNFHHYVKENHTPKKKDSLD